MSNPIHVLGISGSLRKGSYNTALLRVAADILPEGMALEIFDLAPIPFFNEDVEAQGDPEPVVHFKQRIRAADALLIATPEYNRSVSGVLKNAIDWASRTSTSPLIGKPLAIMGAGNYGGTVRAQMHLRQIAQETEMLALIKPEVMIEYPWNLFDEQGQLHDEKTRQRVRRLLDALAAWVRRLGPR